MQETRTLRETVEKLVAASREILLNQGSHMPTIALFGQEKSAIAVLAMSMGEPGEERTNLFRDLGAKLGDDYGRELGPLHFVIHAAEAWGRVLNPGETKEYKYLENDPQREEALVISGYSPTTGETIMRILEMRRDIDGELVAVEEKPIPTAEEVRAYLLEAFAEGYALSLIA